MRTQVKRACLPLLLLADLALAQPMPPDSVWVEPATWPDGRSGYIVYWTAVEGADGYRIYREVAVTQGLDEDGNLVELDQPRFEWISWGFVETTEPVEEPVEWMAVTLDGDAMVFAIAAVQGDEESEFAYVHVPETPRFVPPPPDSVWVEQTTFPDGAVAYVIFWSAVEGAVGYSIYREMDSSDPDEPQLMLVAQVEATEPTVQWTVDEPDEGEAVFAISTFSLDEESEPVYIRLREIATAVRARSWGQVKALGTTGTLREADCVNNGQCAD